MAFDNDNTAVEEVKEWKWTDQHDVLLSAMADVEERGDRRYSMLNRRVEKLERSRGGAGLFGSIDEQRLIEIAANLVMIYVVFRVIRSVSALLCPQSQ